MVGEGYLGGFGANARQGDCQKAVAKQVRSHGKKLVGLAEVLKVNYRGETQLWSRWQLSIHCVVYVQFWAVTLRFK